MIRVTFVENRGKTVFWSAVANMLKRRGHQISWIVQNPLEAPKVKGQKVVRLRFPRPSEFNNDAPVPMAMETDRGRMFFGAGQGHYSHYETEIGRALDVLKPDLVIGEATLFHELLAIAACRVRAIPYLHPTGTRYPGGRMVIFDGDTQIPVAGSGEIWPEDRLIAASEALCTGDTLPDYMRIPSRGESLIRKVRLIRGQLRTLVGRIRGERYNTPSLACKIALSRDLKTRLTTWRSLERAPDSGPATGPVILYPLQMQPEANIEVWGRPFHDQFLVIERCLSALPPNGQLAVKANPKAKYEVSKALLDLARRDKRIVLLPLDWRMPQAHAATIGAVTVTGTVGYEAVFGRGRCISLRHPVIAELFPTLHAETPEAAVTRLLTEPSAGQGSPKMTRQLLERIIATSFTGVINELAYAPNCMSEDNLRSVCDALELTFNSVLQ